MKFSDIFIPLLGLLVLTVGNAVVNMEQHNDIKEIRTEQKMTLKNAMQEQLFQLKMNKVLDTTYAIEPTHKEKTFFITAYCPCEICCGRWADGITANGHKIIDGDRFVAAPKSIPFGTEMDIPGYGIVAVKDRGGAIKGNKLDVFFNTHQEALNWGVKKLTVTVFVK